jgi:F0F1-type ATP synthase delta subunit
MKLDKYTVGKRYGKALFELAMEEQQTLKLFIIELMTSTSDLSRDSDVWPNRDR